MSSCSSIDSHPRRRPQPLFVGTRRRAEMLVANGRGPPTRGAASRGGSFEPTAVPEAPLCALPASLDPLEHETSCRGPLTKWPTMSARRDPWGDVYSLHTLLLSMSSGPARRLTE